MLSQTSEYALRVITYLAIFPDKPAKHADIARVTQVPSGYLYKVLQTLDRGGLVHGQRGMHGGFTLARPASEISVLNVITAVDSLPRVRMCPLKLQGHAIHLCALHRRIDAAFAKMEEAFAGTSIAELVTDQNAPTPMCANECARECAGVRDSAAGDSASGIDSVPMRDSADS